MRNSPQVLIQEKDPTKERPSAFSRERPFEESFPGFKRLGPPPQLYWIGGSVLCLTTDMAVEMTPATSAKLVGKIMVLVCFAMRPNCLM